MPEPDLGDVLTAATIYGDQRAAAERVAGDARLAAAQAALAGVQAEFDAYRAAHPDTPTPPASGQTKVVGMSAPAGDWANRVAETGKAGIRARRIFCDLAAGAQDKKSTIEQAVADGMLPVISYKVGGDITGALAGKFDAVAKQAAVFLDSFGVEMAVTLWHEPNGDITGQQLIDLHARYLPVFKRGKIKVGPILNGWQLDRPASTEDFKTYVSKDLCDNVYTFFGIDSYQNPGNLERIPSDRIDPLIKVLDGIGHADMPLLVGEYNCHTADAITKSGQKFLDTPTMWCFLIWNANGSGSAKATVLTGDRLAAFKATKSDPRAQQ